MTDLSSLHRQIHRTHELVASLGQAIGQVDTRVGVLGQKQEDARSDLLHLRADFAEFVEQAQRDARVSDANLKILKLKGELEHQFGHHDVVRRTAVGMLRAFDLGLVRKETVRAIGEQLMVQTPRYWLAPVLVALAAWSGDAPDRCVQAVEEAYRRSPGHTSLFLTLVLRRQGRRSSAVRWLEHYLEAQDPAALNREFAVVLEAVAQGAFGPGGLEVVRGRVDGWHRLLLDDEAVTLAQVNRWRREMETHVQPDAVANDFPRLAEASPEWPQLHRALACAEAHQSIVNRYRELMNADVPPSSGIEDAIDDILDQLVEEYDFEELPLRRELVVNEAIVAARGSLTEARAVERESTALNDTRDYLTIQTESALNPDEIGVSTQTQRLAVAFCHDWMSTSHAAFTRDYRVALPGVVSVTFDLTDNLGLPGLRLPRWTGSFDRPVKVLEQSLSAHWNRHTERFLSGLAFEWHKRVVAPAVVLLLVLLVVSVVGALWLGIFVTLGAGVIWGLVLKSQADDAAEEQRKARERVAQATKRSLVELRAAGAELSDWTSRFSAADAKEADVKTLIADLATVGAPSSPYERRVVGRLEEA
ncbi:hypothetical protein [Micromonospora sp. NPDC023888]|uniref:hypothetical protein n=1 Tax=Micromonospora sp. NPDC023888 TaxID=3155607 RepID=UPI0034107A16